MINRNFDHSWDLTPAKASELQTNLAQHVITENQVGEVKLVAGVDASYKNGLSRAAIAILRYPELDLIDYTITEQPTTFPYVPGLLSFREGPIVLAALAKLKVSPDLLIFDGQGLAHPRRFGLACHIGLLTDIPSIGCAKTRLIGSFEEVGPAKGDYVPLIDKEEVIGAMVRTRTKTKPVFVSIGHRIDLATSRHFVLSCCTKYRLPETTRWADKIAGGLHPQISTLK